MKKEEIIELLSKVITPIYQIEENLGMPKTTLQKAVKGERELPKKWSIKLLETYPKEKKAVIVDLNKPTNEIKPPEKPQTSFTIDTTKKVKGDMPDPKKDRAAYARWCRENH